MTEYLQAHPYTIIGFLALGLFIALLNHLFIRRLGGNQPSGVYPPVSILVPARNEAANIEACLLSLLEQDYPSFEILVLDDQSTDETRLILDRLAGSTKSSLRVLDGSPPPAGWLGKHWACHQLGQQAKGDLFLFTDADTRHRPNMLRDSVSMLLATETDLLTAFPREEVLTWGERLTVPILSFAAFSFLPVFLASRLNLPFLSLTVGQLILIRRSVYDAVRGHEAVRAHAVDDVSLGRRVIAHGFKWMLADATDHAACRMYSGFQDAMEGFTKNLFAFFDHHTLLYLVAWTWMAVVFLEPPLILLSSLFGVSPGFFPPSLAWIAWLESTLLFGIAFHRFRFPKYLVLLHPVSMAIFVFIACRSLVFTWAGLGRWKDRRLPRLNPKW